MSNDLILSGPTTATTAESSALWPSLLKGRISDAVRRGDLTPENLPELRALEAVEAEACKPVSTRGMVALLEALFQHYYAVSLTPEAQQQRWRDWHEDVGHLPGSVLAEACAVWRRSAAKHAPSPGQLLAKTRKDYPVRLLAVRRAIAVLADTGVDNKNGHGL